MNWNERLRRWLIPQLPANEERPGLAAGISHFQRERDGAYIRYHLRVEADGSAVLVAGAAEAVRLSPLGAMAAKGLLDGRSKEAVAAELPVDDGISIVEQVATAIEELGRPDIRFPIFSLTDADLEGRRPPLMAPFQADLVPGRFGETRVILERLWDVGVFHVRLLPDQGAVPDSLWQIVESAEDLGLITGLRASAGAMADESRVKRLAAAGLDYVVVPWGVTPEFHTAIYGDGDFTHLDPAVRTVRSNEMTTVLEVPLLTETLDALDDQIERAHEWQVSNLEVFAVATRDIASADGEGLHALAANELPQAAVSIEDLAEEQGLQIAWQPPVDAGGEPAQVARAGPRAAGDGAIRVDAAGFVYPARGPCRPVGNVMRDPWQSIWEADVFTGIRTGRETRRRCESCPGLAVCQSGCPADPDLWSAAAGKEAAS